MQIVATETRTDIKSLNVAFEGRCHRGLDAELNIILKMFGKIHLKRHHSSVFTALCILSCILAVFFNLLLTTGVQL